MSGPKIIFTIPLFGGIPVTETVRNSWIAMAILIVASILITRNLKKIPTGMQVLAEKGVAVLYDLVDSTMGSDKLFFAPYIGTLFLFSVTCNLMGLFTLRPPTADINTTACWAIIMFGCCQYFGVKRKGLWGRIKGFADPVAVALPMNLISEFSNPISMAFRHFGNIVSGVIISSLIYMALSSLTAILLGGLTIPILTLGIPAVLSVYFDLFAGFLQAFIICMLTMVFVGMAMD